MPFAPTDIAGLLVWVKADTYSLADNATITTAWADQSGNAKDGTPSDTPVFRTAQTPAGGPAVKFNTGYVTFPAMFSGTTAAEAFIVVKADADPQDGPFLWQMGGSDRTYYPYTDGNIYDGAFTSTRFQVNPTPSLAAWRIYNVSCGGGTWTSRLDGTQIDTHSQAYSAPGAPILGGAAYRFLGMTAEFLVYNSVLNSTDRASVISYLQTRHFSGGTATVADTAAAADTVTRSQSRARAAADSAPAVDTLATSGGGGSTRAVADSAPATDAVSRARTGARAAADSAPAVDTVTSGGGGPRAAADSAPAVDTVGRTVSGGGTRAVAASAPAVDTVSRGLFEPGYVATPTSPANGAEISAFPTLAAVPTANVGTDADVQFQLSTDPMFTTVDQSSQVDNVTLGATATFDPAGPLDAQVVWHWRVRAGADGAIPTWGSWSVASTGASFSVVELPYTDNSGYWVDVYDYQYPSKRLAQLRRFEELSLHRPVNDPGSITITFDRDDPVFRAPLPDGTSPETLFRKATYWRVIENGKEIIRGFFEGLARPQITDQARVSVITCAGRGKQLDWAKTLPAGYAAPARAYSRKFVNRTWSYVFITLLNEARARGALPADLNAAFTGTHDSEGVLIPASEYYDHDIALGTSLLELLTGFAEKHQFSWRVGSTGRIYAAYELGIDRSTTIRFLAGVDIESLEDVTDASTPQTVVYVEDGTGVVSDVRDNTAKAAWGGRELYLQVSDITGSTARNAVAAGLLAVSKVPLFSQNLSVDPFPRAKDGTPLGRRAFWDYNEGDIVGYGPANTGSTLRVVDIGLTVDSAGSVNVELVVESRLERTLERLKRVVSRRLQAYANQQTGSSVRGVVDSTLRGAGLYSYAPDAFPNAGDVPLWNAGTERWDTGPVGGFGGDGLHFVQPDPPTAPGLGAVWFDTDDTCPP